MPSKMTNQFGTIEIETEVIATIAGLAAMDCYGIVGMAAKNVKDGLVSLLKLDSITKGVKISLTEEGVAVELRIIVEYGTNIPAITDSVISTVKYKIEDTTGLKVTNVFVYVEGVRVQKDV